IDLGFREKSRADFRREAGGVIMSRRRWIGIIAALAIPVGFLCVVLIDNVMYQFVACLVVRQKLFDSPSGGQLVVVVWKSCGATVPDSTQASIVPRGR